MGHAGLARARITAVVLPALPLGHARWVPTFRRRLYARFPVPIYFAWPNFGTWISAGGAGAGVSRPCWRRWPPPAARSPATPAACSCLGCSSLPALPALPGRLAGRGQRHASRVSYVGSATLPAYARRCAPRTGRGGVAGTGLRGQGYPLVLGGPPYIHDNFNWCLCV